MKVLVTGATGNLGSAVCKTLLERGFEVSATDQRYRGDFPVRVELADIRDEHSAYRLMEGMDAVVHLANWAHANAGPSPARLLSENVTMNANIFTAAAELGVKRVIFSSSVQVIIPMVHPRVRTPPYALPYLPLDGDCPPDTRANPYGLSKLFGEQMLRGLATAKPDFACTAIRYPLLVSEWLRRRFTTDWPTMRLPRHVVDFQEATTHLTMPDAADLVVAVLERQEPGFHQYFPAQAMDVAGHDLPRLLSEFYPGVPVKKPISSTADLVDLSALRSELNWAPKERIRAEFLDD